MKAWIIHLSIAFVMIIACYSCGKEFSCEGCIDGNIPPNAVAGPDHVIKLPVDSVLLDGSASGDPNGSITNYGWRKITGPAAFNIISPDDSITRIRSLIAGIYAFELTVTDNGGLSTMDTVQVTVNDSAQTNRPPIANAGPDKVATDSLTLDGSGSTDPDNNISSYLWVKISGPASFLLSNHNAVQTLLSQSDSGVFLFTLTVTDAEGLFSIDTVQVSVTGQINRPPIANAGPDKIVSDSLTLDGSASSDPDNNITSYQWVKISGPSSSLISNPNEMRTLVSVLNQGVYLFELKVTDAKGLFTTDTVQVIVTAGTVYVPCDNSFRPLVNAQLVPVTSFPIYSGINGFTNEYIVHGSKIYFLYLECRDCTGPTKTRAYYNIYDLNTQTWSKSSEYLVTPRGTTGATMIAAGNRIFYAGGTQSKQAIYFAVLSDVDIYDITNNTWASVFLSAGGYNIAGAIAGNKVMFAGGIREDPVIKAKPSSIVDIYDLTTNTLSVASLSEARGDISVVTSNGKVYFAGGSSGNNAMLGFLGATDVIDIYDYTTNTWSVSALAHPRTYLAQIAVGNKIFWAGGFEPYENAITDVEIRDVITQTSTRTCLHKEKVWWYGKNGAASINNNKIVFFTGAATSTFGNNTSFDIYDVNSNSWSVGKLPVDIGGASIFSFNNTVYVVGGIVNEVPSARIWKLVF